MTDELYKRYRPQKTAEIVGNQQAVSQLVGFVRAGKLPHFLLLTGPSGTGKTTLARIVAKGLQCHPNDLQEMNAASSNGVDMVRQLQQRQSLAPMAGPVRVIIVDEAHQLTAAAQEALLKMLEDTPAHLYYFFCTTDPKKLKPTIKTRATEVAMAALTEAELTALVQRVVTAEGVQLDEEVVEKVVECAEGSPRKALVLLGQAITQPDTAKQLAAVSKPEAEAAAFAVAQAIHKGQAWGTIAGLLKKCTDEPETVRRVVVGYLTTVTLGMANPGTTGRKLALFVPPWYDTPKAQMVATCLAATQVD